MYRAAVLASGVRHFQFGLFSSGFLEFWSENNYVLASSGQTHYMRGGKPGAFPSLKKEIPHPIPFELFDPFNLQKNKSDEWKAEKSRVGCLRRVFFNCEDRRSLL